MPLSVKIRTTLKDKKYAYVTTLLVHMALLVLILMIRVQHYRHIPENQVVIEIKTLEEIRNLEVIQTERLRQQASRQNTRNIAVDQNEDRIEKYDEYADNRPSRAAVDREVNKRISQAIKDIIKENNLKPDDRELPKIESGPDDLYKAKKIEEEQVYRGPTNIYYKLDGRKVVYLHVPVYKCQGGATVQVDIRVGQRGKVELVTINGSGTDTRDPCFLDAAKEAAQRTRFSFNSSAPLLQNGYIIYHFVAQ